MKKLFYEDTHILDFETTVISCTPNEKGKNYLLVLEETAFFPEEGGQPADTGTLNDMPVLDVQIKKDIIYHIVKQPFEIGQSVIGHVDWSRRFDFMQQHSGEHIISGLLHKHFGFNNVGFHLGLCEVTLDFDGVIDMTQLKEIEAEANQIVWKNLPVYATFPDKDVLSNLSYRSKIEIEGPVRIVEIPGVDVCACCAPHVESTGEIGLIKITSVQNHRGGVRINILCGERALNDYSARLEACNAISVLLSAKSERIVEAVKKVQDDTLQLKVTANQLANQLLSRETSALPSPEACTNPILFVELSNPVAIRNTVNELVEKYSGFCGIFNGNDTAGYSFIIGSKTLDCRTIATALRETLSAKGGGTAPMIQGNIYATKEQLEAFFAQI